MTAFNIALVALGFGMAAVGGWRGTRDAASLVPHVEHQEVIKDHSRYRFVDGRWSVRNGGAQGAEIEYYDETDANPDEEDYRLREWIGGRVQMKSRRYWQLRLWPATWQWAEISFPAPMEIGEFKYRRGEYKWTQLSAVPRRVTISAPNKTLVYELNAETMRQFRESAYPKGKLGWWKWLRTTSAGYDSGITLRGRDAKDFFALVQSLQPGAEVTLKVEYYEWDISYSPPLAERSFVMSAPPKGLWAAAPEVPL